MTSKTKQELRNEYKVSTSTMRKWLLSVPGLELGLKKNIFTPLEVFKIYLHLGSPLDNNDKGNLM